MSNTTHFQFYNENGFAATLADALELDKTSDGQAFLSLPVYCKEATLNVDEDSDKNYDPDALSLIAYVRIYDKKLMKKAEKELNKGDFVRLSGTSMLTTVKYIDEESGEENVYVKINVTNYTLKN